MKASLLRHFGANEIVYLNYYLLNIYEEYFENNYNIQCVMSNQWQEIMRHLYRG